MDRTTLTLMVKPSPLAGKPAGSLALNARSLLYQTFHDARDQRNKGEGYPRLSGALQYDEHQLAFFCSCSRPGMNICGDLEVFGNNFDTDTKHFEVDCEQTDGPKFRELFAQVLQQL